LCTLKKGKRESKGGKRKTALSRGETRWVRRGESTSDSGINKKPKPGEVLGKKRAILVGVDQKGGRVGYKCPYPSKNSLRVVLRRI